MATNKEATFSALNGSFLDTSDFKINEEYLNDSLQIYLSNEKFLYDAMTKTKRKPEAVAWEALTFTANMLLANENYPNKKIVASSEQLKKWLNEFGNGYETIKDTVNYIIAERQELKEWDEKEGKQDV